MTIEHALIVLRTMREEMNDELCAPHRADKFLPASRRKALSHRITAIDTIFVALVTGNIDGGEFSELAASLTNS